MPSGATAPAMTGYSGPADKYLESGMSPLSSPLNYALL